MDTTDRFWALAVGLALLSLVVVGVVASAAPAVAISERPAVGQLQESVDAGPPASGGFVGAAEQVDPDTVLLNVALGADGDAAWTVEYRVRLDDANTTEAFAAYRDDIEGNVTEYETQFADRLAPTVRTAENATGREMALGNMTVEAVRRQLPQEYGVVTYRFEWTNFGVIEGDRLGAGDALAGFFLDEETTMSISWPASYRLDSVAPPADATSDNSVSWEGPLNFDAEEPRLVVTSRATTQSETTDAAGNDGAFLPGWTFGIGVLLIAVAVVAAYWYRERYVGTGDTTGEEDDDEVPPDLLTDEERVVALLEDRGGRVKQQDIAGEFDWTDAKTSQVVKRLRENDDVDVLRIGRENVVSLPEESDI